jgi:hypothetical protein
MDLYIHSPIRIHGVMLNKLSTGTTLPLSMGYNRALVKVRHPLQFSQCSCNHFASIFVIFLSS